MVERRWRWIVAVGVVLPLARTAFAQDLEPRLYTSAPTGLNFLAVAYSASQGGVLFDPSVPLEDANIDVDGPALAYVRSLGLWDKAANFDALLPRACLDGYATFNGSLVTRSVCGFADPRFRLSVNFHGAPALAPREFASFKQDFIVGASVQVTAPWGQYDEDRLVNIGTNRWSVKPEIGMSKNLEHIAWEMAAAVTFYDDNEDFVNGTLKVDPIYSLQAHVVHVFERGAWLAGDATYYRGGKSTIGTSSRDDLQENWRLGVTFGMPLTRNQTLRVHASSGVSTRTGTDFDTVAVAWQYRWVSGS
jgi:hypothetical protein